VYAMAGLADDWEENRQTGKVDFSDAGDWSLPPAFPWTDTLPSGVKLPKLT